MTLYNSICSLSPDQLRRSIHCKDQQESPKTQGYLHCWIFHWVWHKPSPIGRSNKNSSALRRWIKTAFSDRNTESMYQLSHSSIFHFFKIGIQRNLSLYFGSRRICFDRSCYWISERLHWGSSCWYTYQLSARNWPGMMDHRSSGF